MNVRTLCLVLLAHGDATGYDLRKQWAEGAFAHFADASFGSIYPALAKLERDGLVACREEAQSGKPARKIYSITEAGRAAFVAAMSEPPGPDNYRSPFAVIAMSAPLLDREIIASAIDHRLKETQAQIDHIESHRGECDNAATQWLIDWGIEHFRNEIAFIHANRARLEAVAGTGLAPSSTQLYAERLK